MMNASRHDASKCAPINPACGESHGYSKLTEELVIEIRQLYSTGLYTHKELSKMYNMSATALGSAIRRRTWAHLP